jgi:probable O-glycosylation ligase (exosortase A-associated)
MNSTSSVEWWRPEPAGRATVLKQSRQHTASLPFWALMGFTFVMLLAPQSYLPALESLRPALVVALLATAAYLWDCFIRNKPLSVRVTPVWLAIALAVWAALLIPFSYAPADSWRFFLEFYIKTLVIFWLVGNVVDSQLRLHQAFWLLTLMAVPLAVTAVMNFFSGVYVEGINSQRIVGYEGALTGNPNDLALMLNLILPLSVALLFSSRGAMTRLLLLVSICLSAVAVVLTFSRGGFLTLTALLLLYIWKVRRRRERRWLWGIIPVLLLSIPLVGPSYMDRLSTITNMEADRTGSAQERWNDMAAATRFTFSHPIVGAGIGQSALASREERGAEGGLVHNVYLQYASELGLPGLILFLMLFTTSIRSAGFVHRGAERENNVELFYFGEALQLSLIAFAISAIFHPVAYHIHFYYMAGLAVAAKNISSRA